MKRAGGGNYFDELLASIRDIRSSEKVFYRKVLEIYELPITFETGEGVEIAKTHKVSERTFKDWLKSGFFRHIKHGTYEKRYK